jgi:protein SCO1/2
MIATAMHRAVVAALILFSVLLGGCDGSAGRPAFQLTDITGAEFGRGFKLSDHNGRPRTLEDFKGKVVAVFFGYVFCPDVCPTTMGELALVMKELGKDAERVQVLFITVDPERDTPALLAQYVPGFDPSFLGLYGDAEATVRTAKDFKVFYQKQPMSGGGYTVDHSAGTYVYDASGRLRLFSAYGQGAQKMLHDMRILLAMPS